MRTECVYNYLNETTSPWALVMCGAPGSGKPTTIRELYSKGLRFHVYSTDVFIEEIAKAKGISYSEAFSVVSFKEITDKADHMLRRASDGEMNIVWDQTNLTPGKHKTIVRAIPSRYKKVCAYVQPATRGEWLERIQHRYLATGKMVDQAISDRMLRQAVAPSKSEGFSEIFVIN